MSGHSPGFLVQHPRHVLWKYSPCLFLEVDVRGYPSADKPHIWHACLMWWNHSPCLSLKASMGNLPERSTVTSMALVTFQNSMAVPMPLLAMMTMLVSESSRYRKMISCSAA